MNLSRRSFLAMNALMVAAPWTSGRTEAFEGLESLRERLARLGPLRRIYWDCAGVAQEVLLRDRFRFLGALVDLGVPRRVSVLSGGNAEDGGNAVAGFTASLDYEGGVALVLTVFPGRSCERMTLRGECGSMRLDNDEIPFRSLGGRTHDRLASWLASRFAAESSSASAATAMLMEALRRNGDVRFCCPIQPVFSTDALY